MGASDVTEVLGVDAEFWAWMHMTYPAFDSCGRVSTDAQVDAQVYALIDVEATRQLMAELEGA